MLFKSNSELKLYFLFQKTVITQATWLMTSCTLANTDLYKVKFYPETVKFSSGLLSQKVVYFINKYLNKPRDLILNSLQNFSMTMVNQIEKFSLDNLKKKL